VPIYEYRRPDGSTFEVMQSFNDAPLTHDPETGVEVRRVLHAPAVHFKGSGFYNTDYGTRRRQREGGGESEPSNDEKAKKDGEPAAKTSSTNGGEPVGAPEKGSEPEKPAAKASS
jgi:putative FmdB family regulatory protein